MLVYISNNRHPSVQPKTITEREWCILLAGELTLNTCSSAFAGDLKISKANQVGKRLLHVKINVKFGFFVSRGICRHYAASIYRYASMHHDSQLGKFRLPCDPEMRSNFLIDSSRSPDTRYNASWREKHDGIFSFPLFIFNLMLNKKLVRTAFS